MRTTVTLDDGLARELKAHAARSGRTMGAVIEDAVRVALSVREPQTAQLPDLPTYGGAGLLPGVDLSSNAALRDLMDSAEGVDALR
jgi:plasmid stability protein